jgi:Skp family chaperone for outer membrane proteins
VKRTFVYLSAWVGLGGAVFLTGAVRGQPPAGGAAPAPGPQARPTVAVFNMAAVMRDFNKAKYQVYTLSKKREEESKQLVAWRGEYIKLQQLIQDPKTEPTVRDQKSKEMLDLSRKIEDEGRRVDKILNDQASGIISELYDHIKTVVDKTAEMNGYHLVFAYPDAVTPEEKANPYLKELKLKPPAAQPFFVAPQVDITGVVVQTLNNWYKSPEVPKDAPAPAGGLAPVTQPAPGGGAPPTQGLPPAGPPRP